MYVYIRFYEYKLQKKRRRAQAGNEKVPQVPGSLGLGDAEDPHGVADAELKS
jgi:hypothetical protein